MESSFTQCDLQPTTLADIHTRFATIFGTPAILAPKNSPHELRIPRRFLEPLDTRRHQDTLTTELLSVKEYHR
jgi:hypothetical protein